MATVERKSFTVANGDECLCFLEAGMNGDTVLHVVAPGPAGVGTSYREAWDVAGRQAALDAYAQLTLADAQFLSEWANDPERAGRVHRNGLHVLRERQGRDPGRAA